MIKKPIMSIIQYAILFLNRFKRPKYIKAKQKLIAVAIKIVVKEVSPIIINLKIKTTIA
jgi:hypothetical protein